MNDLFKQEDAAITLIEFEILQHISDDVGNREHDHRERQMIFQGQGKILLALMQEDQLAQKELAERLNLTAQSTTEFVRKLEKKGFVTSSKSAKDKRINVISITDAGRKEITSGTNQIPSFLAALNNTELNQLIHILNKLNQHMYEEISIAKPTWFNKFHQTILKRMLDQLHAGENK
ncbi:MarR family winged helix-turn-helix transcriptional regulator [Furfurilactobacillus entadae]|uniref:MarR family winged helix-turn-helix transcriptional regulator n=1 Tax=Furfurilactobacillus entadae TaxID=2922307 RepID=UPI0035F0D827